MSDTPRLVVRLVAKHLVIKSLNCSDRRLVDVSSTEDGKDILLDIDVKQNDLSHVLSNLDAEEALVLSNLLDILRS